MKAEMRCLGIKASEGEFEGVKSSSTTFHMVAALKGSGWGEALGGASVKMKFGDASEYAKWKHLKNSWPEGGVVLACDIDISAGSDGKPSISLVDVKPPSSIKA